MRIPWAAIAVALLLCAGIGLAVAGVYILSGPGWALLAGALPCLWLSAVILRGLLK